MWFSEYNFGVNGYFDLNFFLDGLGKNNIKKYNNRGFETSYGISYGFDIDYLFFDKIIAGLGFDYTWIDSDWNLENPGFISKTFNREMGLGMELQSITVNFAYIFRINNFVLIPSIKYYYSLDESAGIFSPCTSEKALEDGTCPEGKNFTSENNSQMIEFAILFGYRI
jgi:hypothetical protein